MLCLVGSEGEMLPRPNAKVFGRDLADFTSSEELSSFGGFSPGGRRMGLLSGGGTRLNDCLDSVFLKSVSKACRLLNV